MPTYLEEGFTFFVGGSPGDDPPDQTAVEQHFLGKAVVLMKLSQVFVPLSLLDWGRHGHTSTIQIQKLLLK